MSFKKSARKHGLTEEPRSAVENAENDDNTGVRSDEGLAGSVLFRVAVDGVGEKENSPGWKDEGGTECDTTVKSKLWFVEEEAGEEVKPNWLVFTGDEGREWKFII